MISPEEAMILLYAVAHEHKYSEHQHWTTARSYTADPQLQQPKAPYRSEAPLRRPPFEVDTTLK